MSGLIVPINSWPDLGQEFFAQYNNEQMIKLTLDSFCRGNIVEIRCLGVGGDRRRTDSGYFDDFAKAAEAVRPYLSDGRTHGVYFVLNPISPALLARANNRIQPWTKTTTADSDIICRNWLLVDCDAKRQSGISATDEQVHNARRTAYGIANWLVPQGFCRPVIAMSGNGAHLHFPISLPNDPASLAIVEGVLSTLDSKFSNDLVSIDTGVKNSARICRLYGTYARKGDSMPDRPHRMSYLEHMPGPIAWTSFDVCTPETLKAVAAMSQNMTLVNVPQQHSTGHQISIGGPHMGSMDLPRFLKDYGLDFYKKDSVGFTTYVLSKCPFDETHKAPDSYVYQRASGEVGFHCSHNSCREFHWEEFKSRIGVPTKWDSQQKILNVRDTSSLEIKSAWNAVAHPALMRECVIEGLARRGEVVNVVAATKFGKSWLALGLLFSVATGLDWLKRRVLKGNVLLLDNELHDETIQNRLVTVAQAMNLQLCDSHGKFDYFALRGESANIIEIQDILSKYLPGELTLVVLDAKYRFFSRGMEENSNDDQTEFHNAVDRLARLLNCVIALVHHSTKGNQGGKGVTDVGSGGGSQARAVDCHLVIRPHTEAGLAVLDAAVRTFPPVEPQALRWGYPLWTVADEIKPILMHETTRNQSKQQSQDLQAIEKLKAIFRKSADPLTRSAIRRETGFNADKLNRLLRHGIDDGELQKVGSRTARNGEPAELFSLVEPVQQSNGT